MDTCAHCTLFCSAAVFGMLITRRANVEIHQISQRFRQPARYGYVNVEKMTINASIQFPFKLRRKTKSLERR